MFYNTTSSLKENLRGQSVGSKKAFQGLRSIEPKFFHNIDTNIKKHKKELKHEIEVECNQHMATITNKNNNNCIELAS